MIMRWQFSTFTTTSLPTAQQPTLKISFKRVEGFFSPHVVQFHGKTLAVTNDSERMLKFEVNLNLCSFIRGRHHESIFH